MRGYDSGPRREWIEVALTENEAWRIQEIYEKEGCEVWGPVQESGTDMDGRDATIWVLRIIKRSNFD